MPRQLITRDAIVSFLRAEICRRIGCTEQSLSDDDNLMQLGLESIGAVLISGELEEHFGFDVDPVLLIEQRTINGVTDQLMKMFA